MTVSPSGASARRRVATGSRPARLLLEADDAQAVGALDRAARPAAATPASTRSSVVLPLPLGPSRPSRVPGVISEVEVGDQPAGRRATSSRPRATSSRRGLRRCEAVKSMPAVGRAAAGPRVLAAPR